MNPLRSLPKVDTFIAHPLLEGLSKSLLLQLAKPYIQELREALLRGETVSLEPDTLAHTLLERYQSCLAPSLKPLINATGVILHTNMGRSVISPTLLERASRVICNYSNLEYNLEEGCRGERYEHVCGHLKTLLGVEDVLVVNNNASAVFLVLNTFAKDKEVVVSRGELVEIGGSFRIPEVMKNSGAHLCEVGATNKTKLRDYEAALTDNTAMLMKVHQSNFSIEGFSESVPYAQIKALSEERGVLDYCDWGSGYLPQLPYGLSHAEASLPQMLALHPSLLSFSGDKLFGSVQAGIIVGKKEHIAALKRNQLLRMLRVDKITLSLLEESIKAYLTEAYEELPTLWLLFQSIEQLEQRALHVKECIGLNACELIHTETYMGGGTLPNRKFPTIALHVKGKATSLERAFRAQGIIGRIESDRFLLDFRALLPHTEGELIRIAKTILGTQI